MSCRAALKMQAHPFQRAAARCQMQLQLHKGEVGTFKGDIDQDRHGQCALSCYHRHHQEGLEAVCPAWGNTSCRAAHAE